MNFDLGAQGALTGEIATVEKLSHQNGEPDLDSVKPGCVFGREVEGDAMLDEWRRSGWFLSSLDRPPRRTRVVRRSSGWRGARPTRRFDRAG
jgi:hypothetical protein